MATYAIPVETGRVLGGRYRVGAQLARGGMAEVFLGHDGRLGREVAIKVLREDTGADPGLRRRFATEGRAAARLSHPNVVGVYDVGEDRGNLYLIMELVTDGTLAERISTGPMPQDIVRRVGLDVLAGLGAVHAAGVVHRDVKPANVLISGDGTAKLADFGIAKSEQSTDNGDATATAMVIGTPSYLAPERAAGAPAGVASDLWAVGAVLYEALTGAKPFQGSTPLAVAMAARHGDCVPLWVRRPEVDPALAAVVHRALSPDPTARYPSAAAMAEGLQGRPRWESAAGTAPTGTADAAVDETAIFPPAPTEILKADAIGPGALGWCTRRTRGWSAIGFAIASVLVALLVVWALMDGHRTAPRPAPTTTVHFPVTPTLPVPTTHPVTTTLPVTTTPATTAAPPPADHGRGRDKNHGDGGTGNGA